MDNKTETGFETELKEYEAVELFMLNCDDRDERLKAHYREGSVIDGKWVNSKDEEEEEEIQQHRQNAEEMDINTKFGLMMMAKSVIEERTGTKLSM